MEEDGEGNGWSEDVYQHPPDGNGNGHGPGDGDFWPPQGFRGYGFGSGDGDMEYGDHGTGEGDDGDIDPSGCGMGDHDAHISLNMPEHLSEMFDPLDWKENLTLAIQYTQSTSQEEMDSIQCYLELRNEST